MRDSADRKSPLVPSALLSLVNVCVVKGKQVCAVTVATGADLMATEDYSVDRAITYLQVCFIVGMMDSIPALGPAFFFFGLQTRRLVFWLLRIHK